MDHPSTQIVSIFCHSPDRFYTIVFSFLNMVIHLFNSDCCIIKFYTFSLSEVCSIDLWLVRDVTPTRRSKVPRVFYVSLDKCGAYLKRESINTQITQGNT